MSRKILSAAALAFGAAFAAGDAARAEAPSTMQPGQRVQLGPMLGSRVVRMVMFNDSAGSIDIIYDMAPGQPQSARVVRLENVNGMLEVVYDTAVPTMALGSGGTPRLVQQGGGMYEVVYDRR